MQLARFGELFHKSWELYKRRLSTLAMLMTIPFVVNAILTLVEKRHLDNLATGYRITTTTTGLGAAGFLVLVALILVSVWVQIAVVHTIDGSDDKPNPSDVLSKGTALIGPVLLVSILVALAVLGGLILLIIPGIIFGVWFAFSNLEVILEGKRSTDAMKASKALSQGRWGAVFGRFVLLLLALGGISIVASLVTAIFPFALRSILSAAVSNYLIAPLGVAYTYFLYKDLKAKHGHSTNAV